MADATFQHGEVAVLRNRTGGRQFIVDQVKNGKAYEKGIQKHYSFDVPVCQLVRVENPEAAGLLVKELTSLQEGADKAKREIDQIRDQLFASAVARYEVKP